MGAGAGAGAQAGPHARTIAADSSNVDLVPRPSARDQNDRMAAVLPAIRARQSKDVIKIQSQACRLKRQKADK